MPMGGNINQLPVGKAARRCITRNFDQVSSVAIAQIVLRVLALSPLFLSSALGGKLPLWLSLAFALALYIALVIPMRFWAREKMRRLFYTRNLPQRKRNPYEKWLKTGLLRYLRGILWGLPFLAGFLYFVIGYKTLDAQTFEQPIHFLAMLLNGDPESPTGNVTLALVIIFGLLAVFGLLFAYGWWRDLPLEYLPVRSLGAVKSLHWSRRILKKYRGQMRKNTCVNFLLALPAAVGVGAVLVFYLISKVDFSLSSKVVFNLLLRTLRSPLPRPQLLELGAVLLVLYLPLWVYRKTRNAALMARLMRENAHHIHHTEQEASGTTDAQPKIVHLEGTPFDKDRDHHEA